MSDKNIIEVNYANLQDVILELNNIIGRMKTLDLNMRVRAKNAQYERVYGVLFSAGRPEDFCWVLEEDRNYLNSILTYVNNINNSLVKYYEVGQNVIEQVFTIKNLLKTVGLIGAIPKGIVGLWNIYTADYGEYSGQFKAAKGTISIVSKFYQEVIKYKNKAKLIKNNNKVNIAHKIEKYKTKKFKLSQGVISKTSGIFGAIGGRIKSGFGLGVKTFKSHFDALSFSKATNAAEKIGVIARMGRISIRWFY